MSFLANLFGGGQAAPTITPPAATPAFNSTGVQSAGQRQLKRGSAATGRASTVLSLNANDSSTKTASAQLLGQ
jgi:hypothetical protein